MKNMTCQTISAALASQSSMIWDLKIARDQKQAEVEQRRQINPKDQVKNIPEFSKPLLQQADYLHRLAWYWWLRACEQVQSR